jgi:hypothetical protein
MPIYPVVLLGLVDVKIILQNGSYTKDTYTYINIDFL